MKRILILLVLGCFSFLQEQAKGCGESTVEELRFWLLQPEVAGTRDLHPFYFSTTKYFGLDEKELKAVAYQQNLEEWRDIVGDDVPEDAIARILYRTTPSGFKKEEEQLFAENAFLKRLTIIGNGWPEFIRYAKVCESFAHQRDPWDFDEKDAQDVNDVWQAGRKLLEQCNDPRVRARITYQLVRLAYYAPTELDLDARIYYEENLKPLSGTSWLEPSAAFYLAGMEQSDSRDLAFAEIFDRAKDKRFRMVQLFNNSATEKYITMAESDRQRATLLVMRCLQHPGRALKDLERIQAWDPTNEHLPLLLCREVNKLENWLLTPPLTLYWDHDALWPEDVGRLTVEDVDRADLDYLEQLKTFIKRVLPVVDADQRPLLLLLDGHLSFIAGDMPAVRIAMEALAAQSQGNTKVRLQAHIDKVLAGVLASPKLTDATRQDIVDLMAFARNASDLTPDGKTLLDQLHLYLGRKLIARGETVEGALLLARSGREYSTGLVSGRANARHVLFEKASVIDYDHMIALLDKPDKTPFELYLTNTSVMHTPYYRSRTGLEGMITRELLLDYKATLLIREGKLEEAALVFDQIPDDFWTDYPYSMFADDDPFVVNLEDPHNYDKADGAWYNKRTFVERMVCLEREAKKKRSKRAQNYYLLGNAWYNMSWHGKYWIMFNIEWSVSYPTDLKNTAANENYSGCRRAQHYYELALREAQDPVLKAMACRMAEECQRNWLAYMGEEGVVQNSFKAQLSEQESRDAYRAIEDCSGYADFVARFR